MKKQIYEIDSNGFIREVYVAEFDEEGNPLETLPINFVIVSPPNGLYRAKWNGLTWIEDMAQTEIDALNNTPQPPTELELLKIRVATAEQVAADTSLTQQELLELLLAMEVI